MIDIYLKPSWLLLGLLCFISTISCGIFLTLPVQWYIKLSLMILVLLTTGFYILRDALLWLPQSWQRIEVSSQGQLRLTNKQGLQFSPDLSASTFVHPLLIILNVKSDNWKQIVIAKSLPGLILFGHREDDQHRKLRVWLRWWKHKDDNSDKVVAS